MYCGVDERGGRDWEEGCVVDGGVGVGRKAGLRGWRGRNWEQRGV